MSSIKCRGRFWGAIQEEEASAEKQRVRAEGRDALWPPRRRTDGRMTAFITDDLPGPVSSPTEGTAPVSALGFAQMALLICLD